MKHAEGTFGHRLCIVAQGKGFVDGEKGPRTEAPNVLGGYVLPDEQNMVADGPRRKKMQTKIFLARQARHTVLELEIGRRLTLQRNFFQRCGEGQSLLLMIEMGAPAIKVVFATNGVARALSSGGGFEISPGAIDLNDSPFGVEDGDRLRERFQRGRRKIDTFRFGRHGLDTPRCRLK